MAFRHRVGGRLSRALATGLAAGIAAAAVQAGPAAAAAGTLTSYPDSWSTAAKGSAFTPPASWKLAFDDEFGRSSVGRDGAKGMDWFAPIHAQLGTGKMAVPVDPAISVAGGVLTLKTRNPNAAGGVEANIQTANSKGAGFLIQNGYVEARIDLPTAHGSHSGLWMLSNNAAGSGHGEIDVVESYGSGDPGIHSSAHWWPLTGSRFATAVAVSNYLRVPALQNAWHTYGVLLTTSAITLYFDRKELATIPRLPEQQVPFYILLSCFTDANRTDGYQPATMKVDYVKAWLSPG